jgi:hypothetical protein
MVILHHVAIDTLTGVAGDSVLYQNISLLRDGRMPDYLYLHVGCTSIANGEGLTITAREQTGSIYATPALDTLSTTAAGSNGARRLWTPSTVGDAMTKFSYSVKEIANAANTDSVSFSTYLIGVYSKQFKEK